MSVKTVGKCEVIIAHSQVMTVFPDGRKLTAKAVYDEESIARARALGYVGDEAEVVDAMTRDHDYFHSLLAEARGLPYSPTLYSVVAPDFDVTPEEAEDEERIVFLLQSLKNQDPNESDLHSTSRR